MASYHFSMQIIQRSKGRSAIAAAAYRAGERLVDTEGKVHDYRRRQGVVYTTILAPHGSAPFLTDRNKLWLTSERLDTRADAQLAREIVLALPAEMDSDQRRELVLKFVQEAFVSRGMVADVAIHAPVPEKGDHPNNHHAHVLVTQRQATAAGLHRVKTREWNSDELLREWRALWARHQNEALRAAGHGVRVDHRTLEVQRKDAIARGDLKLAAKLDRKPEIHLGKHARPKMVKQRQAKVEKAPHPLAMKNAGILRANARRARDQLDMWRRAYAAQANKPRPAKEQSRKPAAAKPVRLPALIPNLMPDVAYLLRRMSYGMLFWEIMARSRTERLVDFESRYLRSLAPERSVARHRVRPVKMPAIPQPLPHAFTPVADLPR